METPGCRLVGQLAQHNTISWTVSTDRVLGRAERRVELDGAPVCQKGAVLTGRRRSYDQLDADAFFPIASADLVRAAKPRPAIPSSIIVQVDGPGVPIGPPKSKALTETQDPGGMDSHLFAGHARARYVMRMNYCGFSAVTRPISVVRRAKAQAAAQAGSDVQRSLGAKAGTV